MLARLLSAFLVLSALSALSALPAQGGSRRVTLTIPSAAPDLPAPATVGVGRGIAASSEAVSEGASSHPNVRCSTASGVLLVEFQAEVADWPTPTPRRARCEVSGDRVRVRLVPRADWEPPVGD